MRRSIAAVLPLAVLAAGLIGGATVPAQAGVSYLTNFTKTANIYDNLDQEFPHSGTGTPGSATGTPNASYTYTPWTYTSPSFVAGSDLVGNNGVTFDITSDSAGHDFSELSAGASLTVAAGLSNVTSIYALQAAYYGTTENVTVTGADSYAETFSNLSLPDFNGGAGSGGINTCTTNACTQTALMVQNIGGGGTGDSTTGANNYYDLTEVSLTLDSHLAGEQISSVTFYANGNTPLVLGVSALGTGAATAVPEPPALAAFGVGLLGLALAARRARRRSPGALSAG